jgi:hypothetical protein
MPADRELAAFGSGVGGLMLGVVTPDLVSFYLGRTVAVGFSQLPWWLSALFAAIALGIAIQVTGWALRVALVAFAMGRLASIVSVAEALSVGPVTITVINGLFACGLIVAAWPRAGRLAKVVTIVLFASAAAMRFWVRSSRLSVFA